MVVINNSITPRKVYNVHTTRLIDKTFLRYVFVIVYGYDVEGGMLVILPN